MLDQDLLEDACLLHPREQCLQCGHPIWEHWNGRLVVADSHDKPVRIGRVGNTGKLGVFITHSNPIVPLVVRDTYRRLIVERMVRRYKGDEDEKVGGRYGGTVNDKEVQSFNRLRKYFRMKNYVVS